MSLFCCGRKIEYLLPQKANDNEILDVSLVENEWYISREREMTKSNYVIFVAYLRPDKVVIAKQ